MIIKIVQQICPPFLWSTLRQIKNLAEKAMRKKSTAMLSDNQQNLDVYWDSDMAQLLETWGEGNAWNEIQFLMVNCKGKVLDIACGTGKTIELLSKFKNIEVYGCDISDFLIAKAIQRGTSEARLTVCDATRTNYPDNCFDYAYSIGSLEHFTEDGVLAFLSECHRIVRNVSFHMIPVSKSGRNEGWITTFQSYHNNSTQWWLEKYESVFSSVYVLDSSWEDAISDGKWFVCIK